MLDRGSRGRIRRTKLLVGPPDDFLRCEKRKDPDARLYGIASLEMVKKIYTGAGWCATFAYY